MKISLKWYTIADMTLIKNTIEKSIRKALLQLDQDDKPLPAFSLEGTDQKFGDYSTNAAMLLAKKKGDNPLSIASEFKNILQSDQNIKKYIEKVEVAGQGFINFAFSESFLLMFLKEFEKTIQNPGESSGKTVLVEYSSPNIAKSFSVGHLRSTIIGATLKNLYKYEGFKTVGENHLGDWGTQFGMIIAAVKKAKVDPTTLKVEDFEKLYQDFNSQIKENPSLKDEAKHWFKKLEEGNSEARDIWKTAVAVSLAEFERIYETLGIKIENAHGESFYEDKMKDVILEVRNKGISKQSEGAEIVEFDNMPPAMLLKSDQTTTYFTRDLAAVLFRLNTWKPDLFIYEVGAEQTLHFKQVFEAVKKLDWAPGVEFKHIGHGLVLIDGKKMSTRLGTNIKIEDVLNEAIKRAREIITSSKSDRGLTVEEIEDLSKAVGIGAVIYFDLKHHPQSNINFDWESALSLEGNSGPYLQYTYARIQSVLGKQATVKSEELKIVNDEERSLLRILPRFFDVVSDATKMCSPNLLCEYLYEVASTYNAFYNNNKILDSENETTRLELSKAVGEVLQKGLSILNIKTPKKM